jgi:plasmid stabilization system protein ParE
VSARGARRLVVTSAAETDLASAYDWYEDQSPGLGAEFVRAVDAVFAAAQRTPASYPVVRGRTRRALLRRFPYGVFFTATDDEVVVLAVVHSRRHPRVWHSRAEG